MKILFTGGLPDWAKTELESLGHKVIPVPANEYVDEDKFANEIDQYDVYVSGGIESCPAKVIEASNSLKGIVFLGVDHKTYIDDAAAKAKNIPIMNTPGANAQAVAELAIMLSFMASRKAVAMQRDISNKNWKNQTGFELAGKEFGLIGSGNIAKRTAKMAEGLGCSVSYWTRSGEKSDMVGVYKDMDQLLIESDIVSLHVPQDAGEVMGKNQFDKMKSSSVLISTAPASLVDSEALYDSLSEGKISSAAFDCFYAEGEDAFSCEQSKLLDLGEDKFFITPHAGWRTTEADDNMFRAAIDHIKILAN